MATWKKVIVSGSDISQLNNDAGYLTSTTEANSFATASFNGTNLLADSSAGTLNFASSSAEGLTISADAGSDTLTFGLSAIPNTSFQHDSITVGTTEIDLGTSSTTLAGLISVTSTDFTGNLTATSTLADGVTATTQTTGDNSTKVATTAYVDAVATAADLDLDGDGGTSTAVDLDSQTLTFTGNDGLQLSASAQTITATIADDSIANIKLANSTISGKELGTNLDSLTDTAGGGLTDFTFNGSTAVSIAVAGAAQLTNNTITKWDDTNGKFVDTIATDNGTNFTITGNQIITGDLIVEGTASFQEQENLRIADRFALFASGSTTVGDGGIVVQQTVADTGELFGYDSTTERWAVTSSFDASTSAFISDAFMAVAFAGAGDDPTAIDSRYQAKGNIFVANNEDIFIYS